MGQTEFWGRHSASTDGHLAIVHFVGAFEYVHWPNFRDLLERVIAEHGHVYVLAHVTQAATIEPQARREFVQWLKTHALLGFANIQPSQTARVLGTLMGNAFRILGVVNIAVSFVDDEEAGRKWVAECERKRLRKAKP